jgi:hypothetical protein
MTCIAKVLKKLSDAVQVALNRYQAFFADESAGLPEGQVVTEPGHSTFLAVCFPHWDPRSESQS